MPIIVRFVSGNERLIEGESWRKLDQETTALGQVRYKTVAESFVFGSCNGIALKSNVEEVIEVSEDAYKARVEQMKKAHEDKVAAEKKHREEHEAEAKRRDEAMAVAREEQKKRDEQARIQAIKDASFIGRARRFLGIG